MKHIKKSGIVMVLILVTALCIGCGSKVNEEKSNPSTENHSSQVEEVILSILVDTFSSRISLTMPPSPKPHNTACVLS